MAELYSLLKPKSKYYDKNNFSTQQQYDHAVSQSTTVYVGNLSLTTSQDSLLQLFSRAGNVKKIVMGINNDGQRCGFCFVIFQNHSEAELAVQFISQTKLYEKIIRVDLDPGYKEGREKGRGSGGNQKRDDFKKYYHNDRAERGGDSRGKFGERGRFRGGYGDRDRGYDRGDRGDRGDSRGYDRGGDRGYDRYDRGNRNYGSGRERYNRDQQDQGGDDRDNYQNQGGAPRRMNREQYQQAAPPQQKKQEEEERQY